MSDIQQQRWTGDENIDLLFPPLDPLAYEIVYVRCHFKAGSGTNVLRLAVNVKNEAIGNVADRYATILMDFQAVGTGSDVNFRVLDKATTAWMILPPDRLEITWTNPDTRVMTWGLTLGWRPL